MNSLDPRDYESLPALDSPAAYICVIRDIDRDRYRIQAAACPRALIDSVMAEDERSFGIELVALLRTGDLAASEATLYARHHARLSGDWLELDSHQLEELRQSALQIDAHASCYVLSDRHSPTAGVAAPRFRPKRTSAAAERSSRRAGAYPAGRALAGHHYGFRALGRGRRRRDQSDAAAAGRARQASADWRNDLLRISPVVGFVIILAVAFIGFGVIRDRSLRRGGDGLAEFGPVATPANAPEWQESAATPEGLPYLLARSAPAHRCASRTCAYGAVLPARTQVWVLETVTGSPVNGSTVWMKFLLKGEAVYLPISYLIEPPD